MKWINRKTPEWTIEGKQLIKSWQKQQQEKKQETKQIELELNEEPCELLGMYEYLTAKSIGKEYLEEKLEKAETKRFTWNDLLHIKKRIVILAI